MTGPSFKFTSILPRDRIRRLRLPLLRGRSTNIPPPDLRLILIKSPQMLHIRIMRIGILESRQLLSTHALHAPSGVVPPLLAIMSELIAGLSLHWLTEPGIHVSRGSALNGVRGAGLLGLRVRAIGHVGYWRCLVDGVGLECGFRWSRARWEGLGLELWNRVIADQFAGLVLRFTVREVEGNLMNRTHSSRLHRLIACDARLEFTRSSARGLIGDCVCVASCRHDRIGRSISALELKMGE